MITFFNHKGTALTLTQIHSSWIFQSQICLHNHVAANPFTPSFLGNCNFTSTSIVSQKINTVMEIEWKTKPTVSHETTYYM